MYLGQTLSPDDFYRSKDHKIKFCDLLSAPALTLCNNFVLSFILGVHTSPTSQLYGLRDRSSL